MIEIVPASIEHAVELAPRLRKADLRELRASTDVDPEALLVMSVERSQPTCWTALIDDEPEVIWGAAPYPLLGPAGELTGVAWLLSSDKLYENVERFHQEVPEYLARIDEHFDVTFNYVHAENTKSRKWLKSIGFTEGPPTENYMGRGETFIFFHRRP